MLWFGCSILLEDRKCDTIIPWEVDLIFTQKIGFDPVTTCPRCADGLMRRRIIPKRMTARIGNTPLPSAVKARVKI